MTDTYGGDANYSWVTRKDVEFKKKQLKETYAMNKRIINSANKIFLYTYDVTVDVVSNSEFEDHAVYSINRAVCEEIKTYTACKRVCYLERQWISDDDIMTAYPVCKDVFNSEEF